MVAQVLKRWRSILWRTYAECRDDQVSIVASGVAFRVTIAMFPAIALLVWVGTQVIGGQEAQALLKMISSVVPDSSHEIIAKAIHSSVQNNPADRNGEYGFLGAAAPIVGLAFMIYSTNSGMQALFGALNGIYDREERRGFLRFTAITLLFTAGALVTIAALTGVVLLVPHLLALSGMTGLGLLGLRLLRWPALFVGMALALAMLYRYAPNRERQSWPLVTIGSTIAALSVVLGTALFSWFMNRFASLAVTYGSLSTVIAFMLWLWVSFLIVLICAELDSCIEAETGLYGAGRGLGQNAVSAAD